MKKLVFRTMKNVRPEFDWMRCQVGFVQKMDRGGPAPEKVFHLLGYGRTMSEANKMAEEKLYGNHTVES